MNEDPVVINNFALVPEVVQMDQQQLLNFGPFPGS